MCHLPNEYEQLDALYCGPSRCQLFGNVRTISENKFKDLVILPGSFNPLHDGHIGLAVAAARLTGRKVIFELSIENVEKPLLSRGELYRRLMQFSREQMVLVTRAATFPEKAELVPGSVFAVGYDTAVRLFDKGFYERWMGEMDSGSHVAEALERIRLQRCRFLVAGRVSSGEFLTLRDVKVPFRFEDLFRALPESEFRVDISSSALRSKQ